MRTSPIERNFGAEDHFFFRIKGEDQKKQKRSSSDLDQNFLKNFRLIPDKKVFTRLGPVFMTKNTLSSH